MPDATTVLDALLAALAGAASAYNSADQVAPVVTLWPDGEELWAPLLPLVREAARERGLLLLTLGPYDPDNLTGPAIWLRCVIAGTLPPPASTHPPSSVLGPPSSVPIVYLPGVSRSDLRPVEAMKAELRPLIELQFRGLVWAQRNGKNEKDWTLLSFLKSAAGGLNLPLSNDAATRDALRNVLLTLAEQTLESLRREPLTPARLNALVNPDEIRSLLRWMSDPKEKTFDKPDIWAAFCSTCKERYGFNPETDGRITAAGFLGERTDAWDTVWNRFVEAPTLYPGIPALLRQARPQSGEGIFFQASSWPQDNEAQETALRGEMLSLENAPPAEARKAIRRLDKIHGARREWVWATLGNAPLARALPALLDLADATESPLTGSTPGDLALGYTSAGWQADAALIQALSRVEGPGDELAVKAAAKALYLNWLRDGAEAFQA
ncbi:MAG TPA: BREX-1 system phosphatase PglZ type B, partial [Chloroflexota bacterium]|nr:BREX-1 system phosphatase PglZ type B [Chloroflexota bacterium]